MSAFNNVLNEFIFSSFVYSSELAVSNSKLITECYNKEKEDAGVANSNKGGYHSHLLEWDNPSYPELANLKSASLEFANHVWAELGARTAITKVQAWININKEHSYNVMHTHNNALLSGVFYVKIPPASTSNLILYRNDGAEYFNKIFGGDFAVSPVENRFFLFSPWLKHSVDINDTQEDRISIAFNFLE